MGKKEEKQLLEAAAKGEKERVEKLLYPKQRKTSQPLLQLERDDVRNFRMKVSLSHINVDCTDSEGNTPLILAVLNGHKELASLFIIHSCNINAQDCHGNSAMHWAAFHYRLELVEMLIKAKAPVDVANSDGDRPLHFAVRHFQPGKPFVIVKLLQAGAKAVVVNKDGDTPLTLAARLNKNEAVPLLVDAFPELSSDVKPLIEAVRTGHEKVVHLLLDNCFDPNGLEEASGTRPLHEAVRFFRLKITELLVSFGADSKIKNSRGETAETIIKDHPPAKAEEFRRVFEEYVDKPLVRPKAEIEREQASATKEEPVKLQEYPLLKSRVNWTHNHPEYRSKSSQKNPNTNLLDGDSSSLYVIPGGSYNWVVFDFGSVFTLTGVRLWGWHSHQMVKNFQVLTGDTLSGPWHLVSSFRAEVRGPSDPTEPGMPQDFKGFYGTSQFWKVIFVDNHGDPVTSLHGIDFYGMDSKLLGFFQENGLMQYYEDFMMKGYNQVPSLATLTNKQLRALIPSPDALERMKAAVKKVRAHVFVFKSMWWAEEPVTKATEGKEIPDIVVKVDPMVERYFELKAIGGCRFDGACRQSSVIHGNDPATVTFSHIKISPAGRYLLEVHCLDDEEMFLRASQPTEVSPSAETAHRYGDPNKKTVKELESVFDDMEEMLKF